jgi:hypothetical protein
LALTFGLLLMAGFGTEADGIDDSFLADGKADDLGIQEGSPEALGVLAVANEVSLATLREDVGLSRPTAGFKVRAARGSISARTTSRSDMRSSSRWDPSTGPTGWVPIF